MSDGSRSKVKWVKVKGHVSQGQIRAPNKGRWAHDNVKLLHFSFILINATFNLQYYRKARSMALSKTYPELFGEEATGVCHLFFQHYFYGPLNVHPFQLL